VAAFGLREAARYQYGLGEKCRRLLCLQDGLGRAPSASDLLDLAARASPIPSLDPKPLGSEFTSELPPGARRLAHILQEATFYTRTVAGLASWIYGLLALGGVAATVFGLWLLVQSPPSLFGTALPPGKGMAKAAATLLVFFATGVLAERWGSFRSLARAASSTFDRYDHLRRGGDPDVTDVLLVMANYDAALSKAPPLPGLLYRVCRKRLHRAWTTLMASGTG
jgi:hypothetical protein